MRIDFDTNMFMTWSMNIIPSIRNKKVKTKQMLSCRQHQISLIVFHVKKFHRNPLIILVNIKYMYMRFTTGHEILRSFNNYSFIHRFYFFVKEIYKAHILMVIFFFILKKNEFSMYTDPLINESYI